MLIVAVYILPIKNAVPVNFFQKINLASVKRRTGKTGPVVVVTPFPNSNPRFERSKNTKKHPLNHFICQSQMKSGRKKKSKITTTTLLKSRFCANPE